MDRDEAHDANLRSDPETARLLDLHREQLLRGLRHDHPERVATEQALEARNAERDGLPLHPPVSREQIQAALRRKPSGA